MNRRSFLSLLGLGAAAMVLDPELALWKPGATTHILPPPQGWETVVGVDWGYKDSVTALKFHKDAFSVVQGPLFLDENQFKWRDDVIAAAVKDLADRIDRDALRFYEQAAKDLQFVSGDQWPAHYRVGRA